MKSIKILKKKQFYNKRKKWESKSKISRSKVT